MKSFSNKVLAVIVLFLFLAVLFLSFQVLRIYRSNQIHDKKPRVEKPFSYAEMDRLIQLGAIDELPPMIEKRLTESETAGDFLSLAKRALQLGEVSDNFTLLESVAEQGSKELPGREDIAALFAYSLLRQDRIEEAEKAMTSISEASLPFSKAVAAELLWKRSINEDWEMDSPTGCDGTVMVELVEKHPSLPLMIDAIICLLLSGKEAEAVELTESLLDETAPFIRKNDDLALMNGFSPTLFSLLADEGRYRKAFKLLESQEAFTRPEQMLLKADLFLASQRKKEAIKEYEKAIEYFPDYSWIPYYNLQLLESRDAESRDAESLNADYLTAALNRFHDKQDFLRRSILFLYSQKAYQELSPFLSTYKEIEEGPFSSLIEQMSRGNVYPDRYRYRLLSLAERVGEAEPVLFHGVWFFYGLRDYATIRQLISAIPRGESLSGSSGNSWAGEIAFAKGLESSLQGDLQYAREHFRDSFATDSNLWEASYNAAMISRHLGDSLSVSRELKKARSSVPMEDKQDVSIIYFRMAEHEARYGNQEEAKRLLSFALDVDPRNPSARSLKSLLDGRAAY